jgi:two-component system phosphate regulon sensor histidine kinase PhoR
MDIMKRIFKRLWLLVWVLAVVVIWVLFLNLPLWEALLGLSVLLAGVIILPLRRRRQYLKLRKTRQSKAQNLIAYQNLLKHMPVPCILVNRGLIILSMNRPARDLLSIDLETGQPLTLRLRHPDVLDTIEAVFVSGMAEETVLHERVPHERWLKVCVTPFLTDQNDSDKEQPFSPSKFQESASQAGHDTMILITLSDQTDFYLNQKIRSDFIANASHELRTPLASIIGFIDTLRGAARKDAATREEFLGIMRDQAERMSRLIDDLLSLNRIEMRVHQPPQDIININDALGAAIKNITPLADKNQVEIKWTTPETAYWSQASLSELEQVFVNLLENAIKYGGEGKPVFITTGRASEKHNLDELDIEIRDQGPGIAAEHLPRLTERFYRIDAEASRKKQGTGLGLAIVKHILNRHRGHLLIKSRPEEGSSFIVRLPLASTHKKPEQ